MINNPASILYTGSGVQVPVTPGQSITTSGLAGFLALGSDGTNTNFLKINSDGTISINDNNSSITVDNTGIFAVQATQSGVWGVSGAVTTAAPVYTNGNTSPLSLTTAGALRVDIGSASISTSENLSQVGGNPVNTGNGVSGTGTQRVAISSDQTPFTVNAAQSGSWSVSVSNFPATQAVSGSVSVSNFPATQTVTGTVTANAGTGNFTVVQATAANLNATVTGSVSVSNFPATQVISGTVQPGNTANTTPWLMSLSQGGNTASIATAQPTGAVAGLVTRLVENIASTATVSRPSAAITVSTMLTANALRLGAIFYNDSTSACFLKFGSAASATSFTYKIAAGGTLEIPRTFYSGIITAIWVTANGAMAVTELTA